MREVTDPALLEALNTPSPTPDVGSLQEVRDPAILEKLNSPVATTESMGKWLWPSMIAVGRGFYTIGRGIGLLEPADAVEERAFNELQQAHPLQSAVGKAVGEAAPFAIAATPIGAIGSLTGRMIASGILGALEGGVISNADQSTRPEQVGASAVLGGSIGAASEALFPVVGRLSRKLFSTITGKKIAGDVLDAAGRPTPEFKVALDEAGISFDDLTEAARRTIMDAPANANPEQLARQAMFEQLGAPYTAGDITQDFTRKATEARLVESAADPLGDPLRSLRLQQSEAFTAHLNKAIEQAGIPQNVGDTVKEALSNREVLLKQGKNKLYEQAFAAAEDIGPIPIATDAIEQAIPDARTIRRISNIKGSQVDAVNDLLVEFGLNRDPQAVEAFLKSGNVIDPLSVQNFDDFRMALNQATKADTTGATAVITGPIIRALDSEAQLVDDAVKKAGINTPSFLEPMKEARRTVRTLKTEFSPESVTGRLIDVKRDGVTPVVESSKVYQQIVGTNKAPELVERTVASLGKSGPKGMQAIGDLQAASILDLLESAYAAQTRNIGGQKVFGATAYNKRLGQLEPQLSILFRDKPETLRLLKTVGKAAQDATPSGAQMPKGSAAVNIDIARQMFGVLGSVANIPVLQYVLKPASESIASRRALNSALKARPEVLKSAKFMQSYYPQIASALGISASLEALSQE